jgi:hypothetical protein
LLSWPSNTELALVAGLEVMMHAIYRFQSKEIMIYKKNFIAEQICSHGAARKEGGCTILADLRSTYIYFKWDAWEILMLHSFS